MSSLAGPFFEIGPKNLLRRRQLEDLVRAAGAAGAEHRVSVIVTVPTALIAPIVELQAGVRVYAQGMDLVELGPSMGRVTAESLADAGADGVMLNHDSNPLGDDALAFAITRARDNGLETIVCTASSAETLRFAELDPDVLLYEPPELIGTVGSTTRDWIGPTNSAVRQQNPSVLMMHAGGVGSPDIVRSIMAAGADGTGSTSGILTAPDPLIAAALFISAARAGWDDRHAALTTDTHVHHLEGELE